MIESIDRSVSQKSELRLLLDKLMESIAKLFNITTTFVTDSLYNEFLI
jgi:hypothetical protein